MNLSKLIIKKLSLLAMASLILSQSLHATVIEIDPVEQKMVDLNGTVESVFGKLQLDIQEKIIKAPVHADAYRAYLARAQKATDNFRNSLIEIKQKILSQLGEQYATLQAANDLYKLYPTEANKIIVQYAEVALADSSKNLKETVTNLYTTAWVKFLTLDGYLVFPVNLKVDHKVSYGSILLWSISLSALAGGVGAGVLANNNHASGADVALLSIGGAALSGAVGALIGAIISGVTKAPKYDGDVYSFSKNDGSVESLDGLNYYYYSCNDGSITSNSEKFNVLTGHWEDCYSFHVSEVAVKQIAADLIYKDCKTISCTITMAYEYQNWFSQVYGTNKAVNLINDISLPLLPVVPAKSINEALVELSKIAAKNKKSIF